MTVLANITGLNQLILLGVPLATNLEFSLNVKLLLLIIFGLTQSINFGLLMRFLRVQVQLRASVEKTQSVIKAIKRSNMLERIFIIDQVIVWTGYIIITYSQKIYADLEIAP